MLYEVITMSTGRGRLAVAERFPKRSASLIEPAPRSDLTSLRVCSPTLSSTPNRMECGERICLSRVSVERVHSWSLFSMASKVARTVSSTTPTRVTIVASTFAVMLSSKVGVYGRNLLLDCGDLAAQISVLMGSNAGGIA